VTGLVRKFCEELDPEQAIRAMRKSKRWPREEYSTPSAKIRYEDILDPMWPRNAIHPCGSEAVLPDLREGWSSLTMEIDSFKPCVSSINSGTTPTTTCSKTELSGMRMR